MSMDINIGRVVGPQGPDGENGTTFTPAVSEEGVISWTNDGGLPNPESRSIKGPQGDEGPQGPSGEDYVLTTADKEEIAGLVEDMLDVTVTGTTPTITAEENYRYLCGEVSTLSFTPSVSGACDVRFTSGTTPAVLTLPNTVKMPLWFPSSLEASTIYEIMIVDGVYGSVMTWPV